MALDLPPLLQPPLAGLVPPADWRKSVAYPASERPVEPSDAETDTHDSHGASDFRSLDLDEPEEAPRSGDMRAASSPSATRPGQYGESRSWDQPRPIYSPRGAPADAAPALSRLEARLAFEPLYMHHYASTRYALVSFMPWALAERRTRFDILA